MQITRKWTAILMARRAYVRLTKRRRRCALPAHYTGRREFDNLETMVEIILEPSPNPFWVRKKCWKIILILRYITS